MITLHDILEVAKYKRESHCSFAKLLAYKNCFSKPIIPISNDPEKSDHYLQWQKDCAMQAMRIWKTTHLKEAYPEHKNRIISDHEANKLLETQFRSLEEGFEWLWNITQLYFLEDFFHQGIGVEKEKTGANTVPLDLMNKESIFSEKIQDKNTLESQLYEMISSLHILNPVPWPSDKKIKHVVLFGSLGEFLKDRIDFLQPFDGELYYMTGPRGLFNYEAALAPILAEWFNMPEKIDIIQEVLKRHLDSKDPKQWTMDLSGLKKEIMIALCVNQWPKSPMSYYYRDKKTYDMASEAAGREYLDCEGGPWPVAMDAVAYYLKQHIASSESKDWNVTLTPIVALGTDGRLTGVDDELKVWYEKYGNQILAKGEIPLFIACNAIHAISYIKYNLECTAYYHNARMKKSMIDTLNNIKSESDSKEINDTFFDVDKIIIAGPTRETLKLSLAFISLAKTLFTMRYGFKRLIAEYEENKNSNVHDNKQVICVKRMKRYYQENDHYSLAYATITLADYFRIKRNFVNTNALLNFASNVVKDFGSKDETNTLIHALYECTLLTLKEFSAVAAKRLHQANNDVTVNQLIAIDQHNKKYLHEIRAKIFHKLQHTNKEHSIEINALYKYCTQYMEKFFINIVNESTDILGKHNVKMSFVYLGSHAKMEATPFSDVEFFILVDQENDVYSKEITKLILLMILNLGETVLGAMGIKVYDKSGKQYNLDIYDTITNMGYMFDSNIDLACKTPLGKKIMVNGKEIVSFRLFGKPDAIASIASTVGYQKYIYFPQLIRLNRLIKDLDTSNGVLYETFQQLLSTSDFNIGTYAQTILKNDIEKYITFLDKSLTANTIQHQQHFSRALNVLLDNLLTILSPIENIDSYQKLSKLREYSIISVKQEQELESILNSVLYTKMSQYFHNGQQKINLSIATDYYKSARDAQQKIRDFLSSIYQQILYRETVLLKKEASLANQVALNFFSPLKKPAKKRHPSVITKKASKYYVPPKSTK